MKKKIWAVCLVWILAGVFLLNVGAVTVRAEGEDLITAPHGVLMEASTGTIIYEKDMDTSFLAECRSSDSPGRRRGFDHSSPRGFNGGFHRNYYL